MRFRFTPHGVAELGLSPQLLGREFDGPTTITGLMGGVPLGIQRWAERELARIGYDNPRVIALDGMEARLLYYVISIRNEDHKLLPIDRFPDLSLAMFEMVPHRVPGLDPDGDCSECHGQLEARWHIDTDPDAVPPTSGPAGTTETPSP